MLAAPRRGAHAWRTIVAERRKVAVVGVGLIGEQHAMAWHNDPRTTVSLVCDLNEERARAVAARLGCDWTTNLEDVANSDVELCSVTTPDFAHREPAVRLAEAGKHLLIEKPLATTAEDAQAIVRAARGSGVKATVSLGNRWMPQIQQARESVQAGEIGEPTMFYARLSDTIDVPTKMLSWAGRSGPQWFLFSHTMDYMRWILGQEPIEVYAVGQKKILPELGIDAFDAIQAMVKFERCFGTFETAWILPSAWPNLIESEITVYGSKGRLHVDRLRQGFELTSDLAGRHMYGRPSLWDQYTLPPTYFGTLRNLIDAVEGTAELAITLDDGAAIVALIEATERSIATGRPVDPRPLMALA
jgi:predicted dehydrogenase